MRLSRQGDYAIRAMVDLAINYNKGPVHTKDIAKRQDIPKMYLSKIVQSLAKAGLIRTVRGNKGGLYLNKKPAKITLCDVIEAAEGAISLNECLLHKNACPREAICEVHPIWKQIQHLFKSELSKHTMATIVRRNENGLKEMTGTS